MDDGGGITESPRPGSNRSLPCTKRVLVLSSCMGRRFRRQSEQAVDLRHASKARCLTVRLQVRVRLSRERIARGARVDLIGVEPISALRVGPGRAGDELQREGSNLHQTG